MTRDVSRLPQLDRLFLTDAGLESDMIYNHDLDLPCFAAITLLRSADGRRALQGYFRSFLELAQDVGTGLVLESATWRASPDWAAPLDLSQEELDDLNRQAIKMLLALRGEFESPALPIVVSGCLGPRGDGYDPGKIMSYGEAADYHARQTAVLAEAGADMLAAITMTNVNEAVGIVRNAQRLEVPVAISFTVETDGTLPTNDTLRDAIAEVDALTSGYPAYYMVNCAHPTHFAKELLSGGSWVQRIRGLRANASRSSHAELDAMTTLDDGDPVEFGRDYAELRARLPHLSVLGGCCGTDIRHIREIARSVTSAEPLMASAN